MAARFPPQPVYPDGIDSNRTLFLVYNTAEAALSLDNEPWGEEVSVVPRGADEYEVWADNGFANINGELFYYDSVSKDDNGKVYKLKQCARNLGGSPTQFNEAGTSVRGYVVAEHHNQLVTGIILAEKFIGENFSEDEETVDWRVRQLAAVPIIADDFGCPDVNFFFDVVSSDPSSGTVVHYRLEVTGTFNEFVLSFGDGTSTSSIQEGDHTYPPNANIDPVVTFKNGDCQVVQTPMSRDKSDAPEATDGTVNFDSPNAPDFTFPTITINVPEFPEPEINIPPVQIPCFDLPSFGDINIGEIPSVIVIDPPINLPSFIDIDDINIPSNIIVNLPSTIEVIVPDISIIAPDLPSTIEVVVPSFPTLSIPAVDISLTVPAFPNISLIVPPIDDISVIVPPFPNISVNFPNLNVSLTVPAFPNISLIVPPFPDINISVPPFPDIEVNVPTFPGISINIPTISFPAITIPTISFPPITVDIPEIPGISVTWGPAPAISVGFGTPPALPVNWGSPPGMSMTWGTPPGVAMDWGTPPTTSMDWGTAPDVGVNWGASPGISVNWGSAPGVTVNWGASPGVTVNWGAAPGVTVDWGASPAISMNWGSPPGFNMNWGSPPAMSMNWGSPPGLTVTWGSAPDVGVDWGTPPDLGVDWGDTPTVAVTWGSAPAVTVDWSGIPTLAVNWGTPPAVTMTWGSPPGVNMNWGAPPAVTVDWGDPPTIQVNVTLTCPSTPLALAATDPMGLAEDMLGKDLEVKYDVSGFPSEIVILPPDIPDVRVVHDIPNEIHLKVPKFEDIKFDVPLIKDVKILPPETPLTIQAVGIPTTIRFEPTQTIPDRIELAVPVKIPERIFLEGHIPEVIRIEGMPDVVRLEHNLPSSIKLEMPEKPEIELVYKGSPIPVQVQLDVQKLVGEEDNFPCFSLRPCQPK